MTAVLEAGGLGKRYGRRWALSDCTLAIPPGQVAGLVGPNGAGKTTLLHLAVGLFAPTSGTIQVLGGRPAESPAQLAKVGFVAQDTPVYGGLTVSDHLRLGGWLNAGWDADMAQRRIEQLGLDPKQRAGKLSGGQRAQLALTLALAKRPQLLILDEPVASLDPLARREFLQHLMEAVAEHGLSVVLSSHLVADLEWVCDYLIVLCASRVQVAGEVEQLLATHHRLSGPRRDPGSLPADQHVIEASHTDRQSTLVVRSDGPIHDPAWTVDKVSMEDIVLAYMRQAGEADRVRRSGLGGRAVIRLAWQQFRIQAALAFGALAALAIALAITGPHLVHLYDTTVATCKAQGDCNVAIPAFDRQDTFLRDALGLLVLAVPALLGVFWGAPLIAREFETGSFRLAWTQSVTRTRWLAAKFGVATFATVVFAGLLSLMVTWWLSPFDRMHADRFSPSVFAGRDIVPIGLAAFACALGVTAGLLIRRAVPAMAATLVAFVGARVVMTNWLRPHFMAPAHLNVALNRAPGLGIGANSAGDLSIRADAPDIPNAWVLSSRVVDAAGHTPSAKYLHQACPNIVPPRPLAGTGNHIAVGAGGRAAFEQCLAKVSTRFHEAVTYQPASRYWTFQWYETLVFLGLGGLLAGLCFWWIRRLT